jgi:signal recognition particle receptor subunit beta
MAQEYKLLFIGAMGAGKTTAIAAVSEIPPVSTEVFNSDKSAFDKDSTTVSMDYGRVTLADGDQLRLYGIPGQKRFSFMWSMLAKGAFGAVLLADASREDSLGEMSVFIDAFGELLKNGKGVLGVGRLADHKMLAQYNRMLAERNIVIPVFSVDVRKKKDVLMLLDALFSQIEANA